jgi:hypothetical protein
MAGSFKEKMEAAMSLLLSRDDYREGVFTRDRHQCVICGKPAQDAHHIMERRLFPDGGYYLDNGASVCAEHHLHCEMTLLSVEQVREAAGIRRAIIPPHLYPDHRYDKWANPVLDNGQRLKGELFFDPNVQKILALGGVLDLFTDKVKYPRTHHVPWSEGLHSDDRMIESMEGFVGRRVIVTQKMDGENTSLYCSGMHARSVDSRHHPSRDWVKNLWSRIAGEIPEGWRICGENLYAGHSIAYVDLPSYFMGFSIWNEQNECLSWDETREWFALLDIESIPVLYDGLFDEKTIRGLYDSRRDWETKEGYVIRTADAFTYGQFRSCMAKFVRKGHVQTSKHWMRGQRIVPNGLKPK